MQPRIAITLALLLCSASARADTLHLANGDTLSGTVVEWALDYVVLEHPQLGKVRLSLDQLTVDREDPPTPGFFGSSFMRGWNRRIDLGWNGKQGNSESINITGGLNFNYRDEFKRWRLNGRYFFQGDEDGTTDNNANVSLRRDWLFPGRRWFAFASTRYQFDEFESWEHRTSTSVGPGYNIVKREKLSLDGRVGATFTREFGERNDRKADALFGLDFEWQIGELISFNFTNDLYLEAQPNAGEIRNLTISEATLAITEKPDLKFVAGITNEYETNIEPGDKKNDFKYYLTLGLGF